MADTHKKPVAEVRIGAVKAAVWLNRLEDGRARYNATFVRLYRDGDQWKDTRSFGRNDLLPLAKVADLVHTRMLELQAAEAADENDESGENGDA